MPAAREGESLASGVTATDQADESLIIEHKVRKDYSVFAELSAEEVAQFAQADEDSPVRYVWKSQYTQDNVTGVKATANSTFVALVNPWPSENNQCVSITVSWEGISQHVIVPGEETKVGHINNADDSLSRMVVEAYDGSGKYIASSDTSASGGGE